MTLRRSAWPVGLAEAAYRDLQWLYPAEFRQRFGPELAQVFRASARVAYREAGLLGLVRLCGPTLVDLLTTAVAEQFAASRQERDNTPREWVVSGLLLLLALVVVIAPLPVQLLVVALLTPGLRGLMAAQTAHSAHRTPLTPRQRQVLGMVLGLAVAGVGVALASGRVGQVHLGWVLVVVPLMMCLLFIVATMVNTTRQRQRPLSWLVCSGAVFGASSLAAFGLEAVRPGVLAEAFLLSYALGCFAVAGWLVLRRRRQARA